MFSDNRPQEQYLDPGRRGRRGGKRDGPRASICARSPLSSAYCASNPCLEPDGETKVYLGFGEADIFEDYLHWVTTDHIRLGRDVIGEEASFWHVDMCLLAEELRDSALQGELMGRIRGAFSSAAMPWTPIVAHLYTQTNSARRCAGWWSI